MLTYQSQTRHLAQKTEGNPTFPTEVRLRFTFEPSQLFGVGEGPLKIILLGSDHHILYDANTGKSFDHPEPPLEPLGATIQAYDGRFDLEGNILTYYFKAEDVESLTGRVANLFYTLPPLLSSQLPEPVYLTNTSCWLGAMQFNLELTDSRLPFEVHSKASLEERVLTALGQLELVREPENRRLLAALHYAQVGRRLLEAGSSPWEFAAEALLNFNKALEVLFGDSMDSVRDGLLNCGYQPEQIERDFIPVVILRDQLDVAHPRLVFFEPDDLTVVHKYLVGVEPTFRDLMKKLLASISEDEYSCIPPGRARLSVGEQKKLSKLLDSMRAKGD